MRHLKMAGSLWLTWTSLIWMWMMRRTWKVQGPVHLDAHRGVCAPCLTIVLLDQTYKNGISYGLTLLSRVKGMELCNGVLVAFVQPEFSI